MTKIPVSGSKKNLIHGYQVLRISKSKTLKVKTYGNGVFHVTGI